MSKNKWKLTDKAKAMIPAWNQRVIDEITMRTRSIDDDEWRQIVAGIHGMYEAANLPHADLRIVRVPSPFMAHVVAEYAGGWWDQRAATYDATRAATDAATYDATYAATSDATRAATSAATDAATYDATDAATDAATRAATDAATYDATDAATDDGLIGFLRTMNRAASGRVGKSIKRWKTIYNARNSGAEWYHWHSFLEFARVGCGFVSDTHANFAHSEVVQRLGGVRYMHKRFVIVSDHPEIRRVRWVGGVAQLHCENGPAVRWRDGCSLYHIDGICMGYDGVAVRIVEDPASLTIDEIHKIENADVRSIATRRFGWHRYVTETNAHCLDYRRNDIECTREALFKIQDRCVLIATCTTGRVFGMPVPPNVTTCHEAQRWLAGSRADMRVLART